MCAQARASRLSFNDIVKGLAATEETLPTFISKKVIPLPCFCVAYVCTRNFNPLQLHLYLLNVHNRLARGDERVRWQGVEPSSGHRMGGNTSLVMHAQHHISVSRLLLCTAERALSLRQALQWQPSLVAWWSTTVIHLPAPAGGAGGALCRGAWTDHPEPVQELPQEERGQQRFCERPQGQDGAAPSLQAVRYAAA